MKPSATSSTRTIISEDFKTEFVKIDSNEQRRVYKAEFNKDYNRYMVLHGELQRVSQRFAKIQRKLKQTPETSPEHQRLKKMIMEEFLKAKNNLGFKRDQEEFQYLHQKMTHIKKLVHDFDTSGGPNKKLSKAEKKNTEMSTKSLTEPAPPGEEPQVDLEAVLKDEDKENEAKEEESKRSRSRSRSHSRSRSRSCSDDRQYSSRRSSEFKRDQEEFQYLHQKLAHINKLVNDFDTSGKKKMVSVETQTIRVSFDPCSSKMEEIMYFEQKKDD